MATRGFNIDQFRAWNNKSGNLRTNRYIVEIPLPRGLNDGRENRADLADTSRILELTCDSVILPGIQMQAYPVRRYGYGPTEMKPVHASFSPVQATFMVDEKAQIQKFFNEWINIVANFNHSVPVWQQSGLIAGRPMVPYEVGYKQDYAVDMYIIQYDMTGNPVRTINLRQAFPIMVGEIALGWAQQHEIQRLPVMFSFMDLSEVIGDDNAT